MQRRTEDRDFSAYNAAQQGRPVRPLAVRAVETAAQGTADAAVPHPTGPGAADGDERPTAVELGSGIGIEAEFLARQGYEVWTYDADPSVEPALRQLAARHPVHHSTTVLESIADLPSADLLLSCATLFFVPRAAFGGLWRSIVAAVRPGGVLAIDLFGENDDWAVTDGTFLSRSQVEDLLQGWASAEVEEREYDGHSFGGPKHWHTFTVIARR